MSSCAVEIHGVEQLRTVSSQPCLRDQSLQRETTNFIIIRPSEQNRRAITRRKYWMRLLLLSLFHWEHVRTPAW